MRNILLCKKQRILTSLFIILLQALFITATTGYPIIHISIPHLQVPLDEIIEVPVYLLSNEPEGFKSWNIIIEYDPDVLVYLKTEGNTPLSKHYTWLFANELDPPGKILILGGVGYDPITGEDIPTIGTGTLFNLTFKTKRQYPQIKTHSDILISFKDSPGNSLRYAISEPGSVEILPNLNIQNVEPSSGLMCQDTVLTIHGQGFTYGVTCVVGHVQGVVTNILTNQISMFIPANSLNPGHRFDIIVTNPNGDFGFFEAGYEILASSNLDSDRDGYTICDGDCDDTNFNIHFGAQEVCNGLDDDCDGEMDEEGARGCTIYFRDLDCDGFGIDSDTLCLCNPQGAYKAIQGGDSNDENPDVPIDRTPPNPPIVNGDTPTTDTTPTWTWVTDGTGNGIFRYNLDIDDFINGATITTATEFTPHSPLCVGKHTLYVQEQDTSGNWSASGSKTILIQQIKNEGVSAQQGSYPAYLAGYTGSGLFGATTFAGALSGTTLSFGAGAYSGLSFGRNLSSGVGAFSERSSSSASAGIIPSFQINSFGTGNYIGTSFGTTPQSGLGAFSGTPFGTTFSSGLRPLSGTSFGTNLSFGTASTGIIPSVQINSFGTGNYIGTSFERTLSFGMGSLNETAFGRTLSFGMGAFSGLSFGRTL